MNKWRESDELAHIEESLRNGECDVFEPTNSHEHDDRCCCPMCSGLCQDDYEYYSGTGQYAITKQTRIKNALYRVQLRCTNWIAEHSFGMIKHYWFY